MGTPLRVLLLEDSADDAELLLRELKRGGYDPAVERVETREAMAAALDKQAWDVALLDYSLPHFNGLGALALLVEKEIDIPRILISGAIGEETAVEAMKAGAHDYILKDNLVRLIPAIKRELSEAVIRREHKRMEEELRDANEQLKESAIKDEFLSTVSHELRTPLAITQEGISQVLDGISGEVTERQKKVLSIASNNIDRLARLINDLLDMSKLEAGKVTLLRTRLNLAELAHQVTAVFTPRAQEKGLTLSVCGAQSAVEVYADVDRMAQILTNLMGNAIKFTERGTVQVSVGIGDGQVECRVADTGSGIAPEHLPQLFSKFQQFHRPVGGGGERGTGLGLAITKQLVELHHGTIRVESEFGQGTQVTFTLPKYHVELPLTEQLSDALDQARKGEESVSLLFVSLAEVGTSQQRCSPGQLGAVVGGVAGVLKESLRQQGDMALQASEGAAVILPGRTQEHAWSVKDRLALALQEHLATRGLAGSLQCQWGCATYPDDAKDVEGLLAKAKAASPAPRSRVVTGRNAGSEDGHGVPQVAAEHPVKEERPLRRGLDGT